MLSRFQSQESSCYQQQSEDLTPPAMFQSLSSTTRIGDDTYNEATNHQLLYHEQFQPENTNALHVNWPKIHHWQEEDDHPTGTHYQPHLDNYADSQSDLDDLAINAVFPLRLVSADGSPLRSLRRYPSDRPDLPSYRIQALYNQSQRLDSGSGGGGGGGGGGDSSALSSLASTPMSMNDAMMDSPAAPSNYPSDAGHHDAYHFGQLMQAATSQVNNGAGHPSSGNLMNNDPLRPAGRRSSISPVHQAYKSKQRKRNKCTPLQKEMLEAFFARNRNPIGEIRERLAKDLDMPERSVQIWFQNKRAKVKAADMGLAPPSRMPSRSSRAHSAGEMQNRSSRSGRASQEPTIIQLPASALTIGSWRRISPLSCYYSKRLQMLTWYIRNNSIGFKLDLPSSYIRTVHLEGPRNPTACEEAEGLREPVGDLVVHVTRPPTFFMEVFKSSTEADGRNNTNDAHSHAWRQCADFTEGRQATSEETHYVSGPYWDMRTQMLKIKHLGGDLANLIEVEGIDEEEDDEDHADHDGNDSDFFTTSEPPSFAPHTADQHKVPVPPYGASPFEQGSPYMTTQLHPTQSMMQQGAQQQQQNSHMQQAALQQGWQSVMPMSGGDHHQQHNSVSGANVDALANQHPQHAAISLHPNRSPFMATPQRSFSYSDASSMRQPHASGSGSGSASASGSGGAGGGNQFSMYNSYQTYPTTSNSSMSPRASSTARPYASSPLSGGIQAHHHVQQQQQHGGQDGAYLSLSQSAPAYDITANSNNGGHPDMYASSMHPSNYEMKFDTSNMGLTHGRNHSVPHLPRCDHQQTQHQQSAQAQQQLTQPTNAPVGFGSNAHENSQYANTSVNANSNPTPQEQLSSGAWGSSYDVVTHIDPVLRTSSESAEEGGPNANESDAGAGAIDQSMSAPMDGGDGSLESSSDPIGAGGAPDGNSHGDDSNKLHSDAPTSSSIDLKSDRDAAMPTSSMGEERESVADTSVDSESLGGLKNED